MQGLQFLSDTKVVLASALYLKAQWKNPFVLFTEEKRKSMGLEKPIWYSYKKNGFEKRSDIEWIYQEETIQTTSFLNVADVYELPLSGKKGDEGESTQMVNFIFLRSFQRNLQDNRSNLGAKRSR